MYYQNENPIPNDIPWVSRRLRLGSEFIETVLKEFFELTELGWTNARCDAEIKSFHGFLDKQRVNGKKGGRSPKQPKKTHGLANRNPTVTQNNPNHLPSPISQLPKKEEREEYTEQFNRVWRLYGLKGNKKPAYAQWKKLSESQKDDATKAIPDYLMETPKRDYRKDFERYLSGHVFEGVLERKAAGCLNIPKNDTGKAYGTPATVISAMPTQEEYAAGENVERDENGEVLF